MQFRFKWQKISVSIRSQIITDFYKILCLCFVIVSSSTKTSSDVGASQSANFQINGSGPITTHTIGIIMNGVTGRMGTNQHLIRSILAIVAEGGIKINEKEVIMPVPVLVGRNKDKLQKLAQQTGVEQWTTDLDEALLDRKNSIYFDGQVTNLRVASVKKAIAAGKNVYCEKPTAETLADAYELYRLAKEAGIKHGVVQDKLWLPGLLKLKSLIDNNFFGRILSVRGEFGYWVFTGKMKCHHSVLHGTVAKKMVVV